MLIALILFIAVGNLALGYTLSIRFRRICAADPYLPSDWEERFHSFPPTSAVNCAGDETPEWLNPSTQLASNTTPVWLNALDQAAATSDFSADRIPLFRLNVDEYRAQLLGLDIRLRSTQPRFNPEALRKIAGELNSINHAWLEQLKQLPPLEECLNGASESALALKEFQGLLWGQMAQLETTTSNLQSPELNREAVDAGRRLLQELNRLFDSCHRLRDSQQRAFTATMREEQHLGQLPRESLLDNLSGLHNLAGLQKYFDNYRAGDPRGQRETCLGWIDIDTLAVVNAQHGALAGDRLLAALGRIISNTLRSDRGADLGCRVSGAGFAAFLGDTGPRSATAAVERIRQTVAESYFEWNHGPLEVTVSCGVIPLQSGDTLLQLLKKAREVARKAQASGGNRTWLNEGAGPQAIQAPVMRTRLGNFILNDEPVSLPG